ncbi:tetratricopeptide repeat protein [Coprobacter sp.]
MRKIAVILLFGVVCSLQAAVLNEKLYRKAEAHFNNREWGEALSMYNILLAENPKEVKLYVSSVVAASYLEAPQSIMHYVELSERNGVPLDSLFVGVDALTMKLQKSKMYENMLLLIKREQPWLKKLINTYLIRFYRFRNEAPHIVEISDELLTMFPDDERLLKLKGDALLEQGEDVKSFDCYKQIYRKDSTNRDALIFLGNFIYSRGTEQLKELEMRYDSLPSPTRMQYATYKWEKNKILNTDFREAAYYLEKADKQYTTPYLRKTLYSIYTRLAEVGKAEMISNESKSQKKSP